MNEPPSDGWVGRFHQGGVLVQSVRKVAGDTGEVFTRKVAERICKLCAERSATSVAELWVSGRRERVRVKQR